jgi:flagellar biosynthesis/type III secretory pathway M-ring protein FliF/YscJ
MTNAFSSMAYPHWLIVAGALLLMLGIVGLALCRRGAETELDDIASGQDQGRSESENEPTQPNADRKARLEEQRRNRWANTNSGSEEPIENYDKESK